MSTIDAPVARAVVNEAALARNRGALLAAAAAMPAVEGYAYERHRAHAYAYALVGADDQALAELSLAATSAPSAAVLAGDSAHLHLLLGDPARAIAALAAAARADLALEPHANEVLLAAVRSAPTEWRPAMSAAFWSRRPGSALVVAGTAFDSIGNGMVYRGAVAGAALATVVLAFVTLPGTLFGDEERSAGVTLPRSSEPPEVVTVDLPKPPNPEQQQGPAAVRPPILAGEPDATLIRAAVRPTSRTSSGNPPPGRPRVPRPFAPPSAGQPGPAPTPIPTPQPAPTPAPAPAEPAGTLTSAPPASPPSGKPAPTPSTPKPGKARGKANAPGQQKKKETPSAPAPAPAPAAAPSAATASPPEAHGNGNGNDKADKDAAKEKGPKK